MSVLIQTKQSLKGRLIYTGFQLIHFVKELALSCIFPAVIFLSLALTEVLPLPILARYDWLLIIFLVMQWWMVRSGLETADELKVICLFHIIGLILEVYKVNMGSWFYPESGIFKIADVPLYSGFMYASVASFLCQAWRRLNVRMINWPAPWLVIPLAFMIYLNFFTHHVWLDIRWILLGCVVIIFFKTTVSFHIRSEKYQMPLIFSFILTGLFIWIAENVATYFNAWQYPNQQEGWEIVHVGKVSSWILLVIVSFLIVAGLKRVKESRCDKI
ncbi:DUF817 domain-containing protein [Jeotgalibacillus haloalkalitolerans]|uniref:DUF817 domain-containing protein n=1 Tax=Jeotgalibacillus haloalkalitolerans TaxID=3104292 RepID=A0ABU5KQE1_9BACL|nr:DUF817 domain-containing protein [Jeotgalibacillus sp. HH7-29]MDZ5713469.1 DUF817 domain-containing protein [Jeotgalibacillus sp. HH7-29]